ncbi:two-component system sensor histidine kinase/response regulator [Salinigranum rubrum]|uniref:histidine kinase n=1 Tax=Salinigranum rubrum TaxID=755307 RepID=A0A2I8VJH1_9EURY|nr:ATP-binding protein [Salinigranum rubrum]AUV82083.1 two-component system sensor histidine kinase/response regulator [Salinigranum rubrum]
MDAVGQRLVVLSVGTDALGASLTAPLERAGADVRNVDAASAALGSLVTNRSEVDCVVVDDPPDMAVLDFVEAVSSEWSALPLVVLAGNDAEVSPHDAFRVGATEYVRTSSCPRSRSSTASSSSSGGAVDPASRVVSAVWRSYTNGETPQNGTPSGTDGVDRQYLVEFQNVVLDASASLMSAERDEIATKVRWTLQSVGEFTGVDRCYVFGTDGADPLRLSHEWSRDGVAPPRADVVERHGFDSPLVDRLDRFENVHVPDTADLPNRPLARALFTERGTAVVVPLVSNWQFRGFVGFETTDGAREWSETEISVLRTVADTIAHTLERRRREEALQRQNERLDTFAAAVSHDLRNPLSVVAGFVDLAQETDDVSHLDRAAAAVDRMEALITDVLALAREGRTVGEATTVRLGSVVEEAWLAVETGDATLAYSTDDLGTVSADRTRLLTVFENLFRNSAEHGSTSNRPRGGDSTEHAGSEVRVGRLETGGFYVEDDGPGIPPDDRETVFEEGYSTDSDGSGLGLAIVSNVVHAHGWEIDVATGTSGGARFEVSTADPTPERRPPRSDAECPD